MAMVVQHNLTAMNASRMLGVSTGQQAKTAEKLSSGYRINRAGDDAAGLKISEKMRSQIRGLQKASSNAQDGVSLIQTAEGALNEAHSILQRMNELAVQGANDTNQTIDRDAINEELNALTEELDRISETTQFNKLELLDGTFSARKLQVGANTNQYISITIKSMNATAIGLTDDLTVTTSTISDSGEVKTYTVNGQDAKTEASAQALNASAIFADIKTNATYGTPTNPANAYVFNSVSYADTDSVALKTAVKAYYSVTTSTTTTSYTYSTTTDTVQVGVHDYDTANATISKVQAAINNVSSQRSALGALQNRLEHTIANLDNVAENTQAAESRIRDTDMAAEMVEYSKNQILAQAGQSMLAQANQATQGVLSLLQ